MTLSDIIGLKVTLSPRTHLLLAIFCPIYSHISRLFFVYDGLFSSLCALYFVTRSAFISELDCINSDNRHKLIFIVMLTIARLPVLSNHFFHVM